jgi:hypothetical protein
MPARAGAENPNFGREVAEITIGCFEGPGSPGPKTARILL